MNKQLHTDMNIDSKADRYLVVQARFGMDAVRQCMAVQNDATALNSYGFAAILACLIERTFA